ncbi:PepSY domain-containing protein [Roseomonas sp. KE0001]|uniref:PepSY domain-containing protein n=1 Tax=unclassified Roseomonas TaxID=2617492 RepID=UPI0018DF82EB|nr:PepSY domain-containing protein [Roseomonas sp. KE0001]
MRMKTALALVAGLMAAPAAMAQTSPQSQTPQAQPPQGTVGSPAAPGGGGTSMQQGTPGTAAPPAATTPPATTAAPRSEERSSPPTTATPTAGANSFTEGQARSRLEDAGYTDVQELRKDDQGVWRGRAMRNGQRTDVGLDFQGNVVTGNAPAR